MAAKDISSSFAESEISSCAHIFSADQLSRCNDCRHRSECYRRNECFQLRQRERLF
jgi:hypothetical protein